MLLACIPNRLGSKTATKTVIIPLRTVRTKNHKINGREFFIMTITKITTITIISTMIDIEAIAAI